MSIRPIEQFDVSILVWFSGLDVIEFEATRVTPVGEHLRYVLPSVIDPYRIRRAAPFDESIQIPLHLVALASKSYTFFKYI